MKITMLVAVMLFSMTFQYKILSVFTIMRHGARAPNGQVIREYEEIGISYGGQLSHVGRGQLEEVGSKMSERYLHLSSQDIKFFSSPSKRCVESMEHFKKGFGISKETHVVPKKFVNFNSLMKITPDQSEYIKSAFTPKIEEMYQKASPLNYHDVLGHYCTRCQAAEDPVAILRDMKKLATIQYCNSAHGIETKKFDPELVPILKDAFRMVYYGVAFKTKREAKQYSTDTFKLLGKTFLHQIRNIPGYEFLIGEYHDLFDSDKEPATSVFFLAHDGNLTGLLRLMVAQNELLENEFFMPKFASHISFELLEEFESLEDAQSHFIEIFTRKCSATRKIQPALYVRILYEGHELTLKDCDHNLCPVDKFFRYLEKNIVSENKGNKLKH